MSWESQGLNNVWSSLHKVQVLNNVFYDFATNGASSLFSSYFYAWNDTNTATCEAAWTIDHNLYRSCDTAGFTDWYGQSPQQGGLSWMQSRGWDANSVATDPLFISLAYSSTIDAYLNDYHLQSNSPAVSAGVNLSSLNLPGLNADKDGTPRPASGPWDIGAYEYNTNNLPIPSGLPPPQGAAPASSPVTLAFSSVVQTCKTKTKIDHATMTTNSVTTCKVKFTLVASNDGPTKSSAFQVLFWPGQGSVFDTSIRPWPALKKIKALAANKSTSIKLTGKFTGNQAGTFIYVTDTSNNVLASTVIPAAQ
jgi:hypothetical protein